MEFGIVLPTRADSWKIAKRAEELGASTAWFYDTALLNAEIFVAMGAAAVMTERITLATGVITPSNRLAPVAASGLAALNALASGRIAFGAGTGFTGRRTMGLGPMRLADLETYVRQVEALLRGERIDFTLEGQTSRTGFPDPSSPVMNISDPVPTHISAFGPRGRKLTARLGAGWIGSIGTPEMEAGSIADMQACWAAEGHNPATMHSTLVGTGCILDDGEMPDSQRARAQAGPLAAVAFHDLVERFDSLQGSTASGFPFARQLEAYRKVYESYVPENERHLANHRGHMMALRPEETHVDGDVVAALTLTGTKGALLERLVAIRDAGYSQLPISLAPGQEEDMLQGWSDLFASL